MCIRDRIYYVHDADGETVLFDQRFNQAFKNDPKYLNHGAYDLKEIARITPKKGRALLLILIVFMLVVTHRLHNVEL